MFLIVNYVLYIISFSFCMALVILKSKKIKFNDELFGSITLIKCRYLFFHDFLSSYCPQQFRLRSSSFFSLLQSKDKPLVHHNLEPHIYGLRCSSLPQLTKILYDFCKKIKKVLNKTVESVYCYFVLKQKWLRVTSLFAKKSLNNKTQLQLMLTFCSGYSILIWRTWNFHLYCKH